MKRGEQVHVIGSVFDRYSLVFAIDTYNFVVCLYIDVKIIFELLLTRHEQRLLLQLKTHKHDVLWE